ncbi:putative MFS family arabinose efflux permease [Thermosporothrix hazakensis]|uniref:Putative proline/betaine transporter n=1 Tax=Thermosporothrix hazakensis TaxID=644383 RepID=A0A326U5U5_THEHA|nr:MFS transporter [Thermosporothrix hazakensis]PZW27143.1 putative MFS family arabinose efflux permease [Thermosporothrix hazakensis]GCE50428.1 MFS transporter [Thermosporothrix hazakensis]
MVEQAQRPMTAVVLSSTLGTAIEWYDFFLYGTMATLVFPQLFFPETDPLTRTLLALVTFLAGFVARPFGGALFGHLGDRIGRKSTLVTTLLLMGISTLLIGFLPGYDAIGIVAPLLLTLLRVGQGLGVGGEWGGAVLLALEYGEKERRGFWTSWPQMGGPAGLVTSTCVVNIVSMMTGEQFLIWGWRIPFFVSALLILVGLFIRFQITETPLFEQVKQQNLAAKAPLLEVLKYNWPEVLLSTGARFGDQAPFYLFSVFVITYGTAVLKLDSSMILNAIMLGAGLELFTIPLFGSLSDRYGRRFWFLTGCVLMGVFAFPYFWLLNSGNPVLVQLAIALSLCVLNAWLSAPLAVLIAERFETRFRYSGASLGYQLAAPFAGGLAPIVALLLLNGQTNLGALGLPQVSISIGEGSWQAVALYIVALSLISFASAWWLKERREVDTSCLVKEA